jgi:hypothetical protein
MLHNIVLILLGLILFGLLAAILDHTEFGSLVSARSTPPSSVGLGGMIGVADLMGVDWRPVPSRDFPSCAWCGVGLYVGYTIHRNRVLGLARAMSSALVRLGR